MLVLVTAYVMEDLGGDEAKVIDFWESIARYSDAIDEHLITINKVKQIIEDYTGIKLMGWK